MTTSALIAKVEAGELRRRRLREETQKALDNAERTLYESRRAESDQHAPNCHCWLCDYVKDYEDEQSRLYPYVEPNYCRE